MINFYLHIDGAKSNKGKTWCIQLKYNEHLITKRCDGKVWRVIILLLWLIPMLIIRNLFTKNQPIEEVKQTPKINTEELLLKIQEAKKHYSSSEPAINRKAS